MPNLAMSRSVLETKPCAAAIPSGEVWICSGASAPIFDQTSRSNICWRSSALDLTQIDTYDALGQFANGAPKLDDLITLKILEATADVRPKLG